MSGSDARCLSDLRGGLCGWLERCFPLSVWGALLLSVSFMATAAERVYSFGVVPQQSAAELAKDWVPFLKQVSERSGLNLRFATAPDIPTFEKRLAEGVYDFAYMNPYHFTEFNKAPGYRALAKEKNRQIKGILVTKKGSGIKTLADLKGQTLPFPAPAAFAASILPRAELRKQGVPFTTKYVSSHDSVYLAVARGIYVAGGGVTRTLEMLDPAVRNQLEVIWTTKGYTPHAFAVHPRIGTERNQVLQALEALSAEPEMSALFKVLGFSNGLAAARDADWDDIRQLHIQDMPVLAE